MTYVYDYQTGAEIREATSEELAMSVEQATRDGGAGVICLPDMGGRLVYVA